MALMKQYVTALEDCELGEMSNILNRKAEKVGSNGAADYIGFAVQNIEASVERIEANIKLMQEIRARAKEQIELIKIGSAKWLLENGVDKLDGDIVSSVSVFDKAPSQEVIIEDETTLDVSFFKLVPDKTAIKKAINEGVEVIGARLETTHQEQSLKVNKKRVKKMDELGF